MLKTLFVESFQPAYCSRWEKPGRKPHACNSLDMFDFFLELKNRSPIILLFFFFFFSFFPPAFVQVANINNSLTALKFGVAHRMKW